MVVWTSETTLALIDFYRVNPFLWLNTHPDYYKSRQRNGALLQLARTSPLLVPHFEGLQDNDAIFEIKRKFKSLQTYFAQERRKARMRSVDADESSKWEFYEPMSFLKALRNTARIIQPEPVDGEGGPVVQTEVGSGSPLVVGIQGNHHRHLVDPFLPIKVETDSPEPLTVWPDESRHPHRDGDDDDEDLLMRPQTTGTGEQQQRSRTDGGIVMSEVVLEDNDGSDSIDTPTPTSVPMQQQPSTPGVVLTKRKAAPSDPGPQEGKKIARSSDGNHQCLSTQLLSSSGRLASFATFVTQTLQLLPDELANDAMLDVHRALNTWLHRAAASTTTVNPNTVNSTVNAMVNPTTVNPTTINPTATARITNGTVAWANQCLLNATGANRNVDGTGEHPRNLSDT